MMPLRVTVELIPHGDESRKSVLATMDIEGIQMYQDNTADYHYAVKMEGNLFTGSITRFDRRNGFLALVRAVADANWMYARPRPTSEVQS